MPAHSALTGTDLHEMKGASTAVARTVPMSDGLGGSPFRYLNPRGIVTFTDLASPLTIVYPSVYTKIAPTTVLGGSPIEVTEATSARLTYTGADTVTFMASLELAVDQSIGANRDIEVQFYKNGAAITGAQTVITAVSAAKNQISLKYPISLVANDYIEAFMKNTGASGDVRVLAFFLSLIGFRS